MNPCLSGWNRGESKQEYMHMCHRVLSRSQLNAVAKLREAGIITSNLVVLPNTSNISLANNGIHVSLGSRKLGALMADPASGFSAPEEKYVGDLVIKILEHFLPLFVVTYGAAPYRLDFTDFHPEKALGFLPHIEEPDLYSAAGKLQRGILNKGINSPLEMKAEEFNGQAERYYRHELRKEHLREAWRFLAEDLARLEKGGVPDGEMYRAALQAMMRGQGVADFIALQEQDILEDKASADVIVKLLHLMILTIHAGRHDEGGDRF